MRGLFITGTDTGVGKTWLGVRFVGLCHSRGIAVRPRKPVESGCEDGAGELLPADASAYHSACGGCEPLARITPFRLRHAISPQRAARLEGADTTLARLEAAVRDGIGEADLVVAEGAGGFYSPLALDGLNADLATRLRLALVLVAPDRLGVINHVLLSLEAAQHRGLALAAVVLNAADAAGPPGMDNLDDLAGLVDCPVFATARDEALTWENALVRTLLEAAGR